MSPHEACAVCPLVLKDSKWKLCKVGLVDLLTGPSHDACLACILILKDSKWKLWKEGLLVLVSESSIDFHVVGWW